MSDKKAANAMERASDMFMNTRMCDLPPLASTYAQHLSKRFGTCGEVLLTAYAHYAQEVEGLPCSNDQYQSDEESKSFFKNAMAARKGDAPSP